MGEILEGDCLEVMRGMEENSVHSIVCDPPYGLKFMGKAWDHGIPGTPFWQAALRVAKPGAYLLAFGGTRTFHRLACAIEDAGWTLRDTLSWNYGSGFPKSKNVALAIDKGEGHPNRGRAIPTASHFQNASDKHLESNPVPDYEAKSEAAKQWDGFGTALKPAWEPVLLFQKPLEGTYAENVLKWKCGALNIDECRIGLKGEKQPTGSGDRTRCNEGHMYNAGRVGNNGNKTSQQGRWPANFLLSHTMFCEKVGEKRVRQCNKSRRLKAPGSFGLGGDGANNVTYGDADGLETVEAWNCAPDCPVRILDEQSGECRSAGFYNRRIVGKREGPASIPIDGLSGQQYKDQGGASRFFYCAKVSREERNAGLEAVHTLFEKREGFEETITDDGREKPIDNPYLRGETMRSNSHPTVKPIALLRYLCRLVTPPAGIVLDPFAGSGSTGCAAALEGFQFIGIEKEKEYVEIARARIQHFSQSS